MKLTYNKQEGSNCVRGKMCEKRGPIDSTSSNENKKSTGQRVMCTETKQ